jgi:GntP family gluconate:H+ symporter
VVAIGAGKTILSHVNDAGFWLVKELFGLSKSQALQSWSEMKTLIALSGLCFALFFWPVSLRLQQTSA